MVTTNRKDVLEPGLIRLGRLDMHINMSYCTTMNGSKLLSSKYLDTSDHPLFKYIDALMKNKEITAAEVTGEMMKSDNVDLTLGEFVKLLKSKNDVKNEGILENSDLSKLLQVLKRVKRGAINENIGQGCIEKLINNLN